MAKLTPDGMAALPAGRLGLIPLESCEELGESVDRWLVKWRQERDHSAMDSFMFEGYQRDTFRIRVQNPRFGSGEGKAVVAESVRGDDFYLLLYIFFQ